MAEATSWREWGVALRVFFDVKLVQTDSEVGAQFGFGSLAAALTTDSASVEVSYDVVGTTRDLLPQEPTIITGIGEYIGAVQRFYRAVWEVSQGLEATQRAVVGRRSAGNNVARLGGLQAPPNDPERTRHQVARDEAQAILLTATDEEAQLLGRYPLGLVSYYVSGTDASAGLTPDAVFERSQQKQQTSLESLGPTAE